ncbi:MAG: methyltransferase domain-containing protein [Rhizobiaceae bacterium]|nr:methyltransferase domain-containing protein [Rhizobiaceae bacterium]
MTAVLEAPKAKHIGEGFAAVSATGCPACGSYATEHLLDAGDLPVNVGVFYDSREAAVAAPKGRLLLSGCRHCGFTFNRAFDPSARIFSPGYEVALHHSKTFRAFIDGVAKRLVERFELQGKRILEIGCGDAFFLKTLAELGGNHCIGVDPTVVEPGEAKAGSGSVQLLRDYFGPAHGDMVADFVCCLSVFEDIPRPHKFLQTVQQIASRNAAPLYFEVFNAQRAFQKNEVWSLHYEQCNYFGLQSLRSVFERNGFSVESSGACYAGDQYLYVEARAADSTRGPTDSACDLAEVQSFARSFIETRKSWESRLAGYRREGLRVVVWGTGGKGITFLNSVAGTDQIRFVAEINPNKHDKYVPGTGQRIVQPEFLREYRPDKIIITNALYENEMKQQARSLGVDAEFIVA